MAAHLAWAYLEARIRKNAIASFSAMGQVIRVTLPWDAFERSIGIYANHGRKTRIVALLEQLDVPPHPEPVSTPWQVQWMERSGVNPLQCTCCRKGQMVLIKRTRGPGIGKEVLRE